MYYKKNEIIGLTDVSELDLNLSNKKTIKIISAYRYSANPQKNFINDLYLYFQRNTYCKENNITGYFNINILNSKTDINFWNNFFEYFLNIQYVKYIIFNILMKVQEILLKNEDLA